MINKEQEPIPIKINKNSPDQRQMDRRGFLTAFGVGFLSAGLAACTAENPIDGLQKAIETLTPSGLEKIPQVAQKKIAKVTRAVIREMEKLPEKARREVESSGPEETPRIVTNENQSLLPETEPSLEEKKEIKAQKQVLEEYPSEEKAQEEPIPPQTPEAKQEKLGGIEFTNMEKPLSITYPKDFDESQTVKLENLQILVSDAEGQNFLKFIRITQYGKDKVFVNQDVSGALILTAHDGYIKNTNTPLELEPFRRMIEGPVTKPVSEKEIAANLEKTIGMEFIFGQEGRQAKFKIVQAKRLNAKKREEFNQKLGNLSEFLEPINHPENSVLLLTCSARQPNEPPEGQNEFFSGRLAFVLEYSL